MVRQFGFSSGIADRRNLQFDDLLNSLYISYWHCMIIVRRNIIFISGFYVLVRYSQLITQST